MAVTSPIAACDLHRWGHLKGKVCVFKAVHIKIQTVSMETIKHKVLSVSKFVAKYQKYVHIKACPARRYIPTVWGQINMTLIPTSGEANCTDSKGYHLISLLSFTRKTM
jgi:hypothetical protein